MRWNRWISVSLVAVGLLVAGSATLYSRQNESPEAANSSIIQYKTVALTNSETQQQVQAALTSAGNAGWRLVAVYPQFNDNLFIFSKP
jgi:hypothetical protein